MTEGAKRAWQWLDSPRAFRFVQALMLVTVLAVGWLTWEKHQTDDCLERYANAQAASSAARAEAGEAADEAMAKLIAESLRGGPAYAQAARDWLAAHEDRERVRKENPVVSGPASFCD
jgi:predicted negative regulator of RcsB-dependent stress response